MLPKCNVSHMQHESEVETETDSERAVPSANGLGIGLIDA